MSTATSDKAARPWRGRLSPSKLSLHPDSGSKYACLRLYRERYITKKAGFRPSPAMARGSVVHKVLENAAKARVEGTAPMPEADVHELLERLHQSLPQVRGYLTQRGLQEAREILELAAPVDFSRTVATELRFTVPLEEFDLEGVIDRLDEDHQPDGTFVFIRDYKTQGTIEDAEELENAPQTLVYLEAMHLKYGTPNVFMLYDYLSRDVVAQPIQWTPDRSAQLRGLATKVFHDYRERAEREQAGEPVDVVWPGLAGSHCGTCPVQATCSAYRELTVSGSCPACLGKPPQDGSECERCKGTGEADAPPPITMGLESLLTEHRRAQAAEKVNEARKKAVADELERRMGLGQEMQAGGLRAYRVNVPVKELHEASAIQGVARELGTTVEAVVASVTRTVFDKDKLDELKANLDDETRARVTKAYEEARVLKLTRSHVRVGTVKGPF